MTNSRSKQTKLIQSRFLRIYCYIFVGSLMSYIRAICARSGKHEDGKGKEEEEEAEAAETETRSQIKIRKQSPRRGQATFAASLQLRAGICIIRLITLKRFLKILAMPTDTKNNSSSSNPNQQLQLERSSSGSRRSRSNSSGRSGSSSSHSRWRSSGSSSSIWSNSRTYPLLLLLLHLLLLLSCHWPQCEAMHGGAKVSNSTVKTKYGLLRGIVVRSAPLVEAFLGIPYASPPVGSLR